MKRLISWLMLLLVCFTFVSCSAPRKDVEQASKLYFQAGGITYSTNDGFYHLDNKDFLKFFDYAKREDVFVCSKLHCKHDDWDDLTPEEERCDAYIPGGTVGFVRGEKLYTLQFNFLASTELLRSNLDRSESELISTFDGGIIHYFVVRGDQLYLLLNVPQYEQQEDGTIKLLGRNRSQIIAVDLKSGDHSIVLEESRGFNNVYRFLAAADASIYLVYEFNHKYFDGTNFSEIENDWAYYKLDMTSHETTEILQDLKQERIATAYVSGDELTAVLMTRDEAGYLSSARLALINLADQTMTTIDELELRDDDSIRYFNSDQSVFYTVAGEQGWIEYQFPEHKRIHHEKMNMENNYISGDAKDYFYMSKQEPGKESVMGFVKKEDVYAGRMDQFIPVNE